MPSFSLSDVERYKRQHPDYDITVVKVYCECCNALKRVLKFPSRETANEYLRENDKDFVVVDYGCK